MPQNEDKKEELLDVSSSDSRKKIDLYINNPNGEEDVAGISIMNIFINMRKRFHIYVFVIIALFLLGLVSTVIVAQAKPKKDDTIAVLGFNYEGADKGLDPKGNTLDVTYLKSSYIIQNALDSASLSTNVNVSEVQANIRIDGILTDETRQQLEVIRAQIEKDAKSAEKLEDFELKYKPQYIITLSNNFKRGNSTITINSNDLSHLLVSIMNSYKTYFNETYRDEALPNDYLSTLNTETLDYLDILDNVKTSLTYLKEYCNDKNEYVPNFRNSKGLSYTDLADMINVLSNSDIDYIYSFIYLNDIYKDPQTALTNYKYQKRQAELSLSETNDRIDTVQTSIDNYQPDKIVVNDPATNTQTTIDRTSDYYNGLVNELTTLNEKKTSLNTEITILSEKITRVEGATPTAEQKTKAAEYVTTALANAQEMYKVVNSHTQELFNSNAYKNSYMESIQTQQTEGLMSNAKTVIIGTLAGLFIGLVIWGLDGLILEIRNVRKQNELKEGKENEK